MEPFDMAAIAGLGLAVLAVYVVRALRALDRIL